MFDKFIEWNEWPRVLHGLIILLKIYVIYIIYKNPKELGLTNLLLVVIALTLMLQVHHKINDKAHNDE